ncbi:glycoside hydrolase family 113 [Flagellimonas sp.]|uniref:glycoside hydrolase family 113 n=1 Tax=Flagellimonas sp. TaxID=2058762 RepID=UPI003F49C3FF
MNIKKTLRHTLLLYLSSWILAYGILLLRIYDNDRSFSESNELILTQVFPNGTYLTIHHTFFLFLFLFFICIRYFVRVYKKKGSMVFYKRFGLRFLLPICLIFFSFKALVYINSHEEVNYSWDSNAMNNTGKVNRFFEIDGKQRGMSVFGWRGDKSEAINDLIKANVEWVAVIPFLYQENERTKVMEVPDKDDGYGQRDSVFIANIRKMRKKGLYIHLKPHLWMSDGWRSNVSFESDKEWEAWFQSYRINMLHYARMAEQTGAELFCVGTELRTSIKRQPDAWCKLISEIKEIYSGKLTYAANWYDEYEHITFWDELDFIGIQAYFPLTQTKNPSLETIKKGWQPHIQSLESFFQRYKKPILFTEVGYKSEASATVKPWEWGNALSILHRKKSDQTQFLAYEAMFQEIWHKEWFAGTHVWEWDTRSTQEGAKTNLNFSPRYKPAENVIAKWYGQEVNFDETQD